jgi:crotonobetainyl-CoA:carnitine CoA-transferase CaiB-like acyl-CoA transferase
MKPFAGLRVFDLSRSQVGAQASQLFADFGAEVVMVEPPGGSPLRETAAFPFWARGTRSLVLDLHALEDRQQIQNLASSADVFIESFRSGVLEALGLGYEVLAAANPGLVYASVTGFGPDGPCADAPGYEHLVYAKLGVFQTFSRMSQTPERPPFLAIDYASFAAAQVALHGILAALHEREASGRGQHVEASLARSFLALDTWAWIEHVLATRWPDALKQVGMGRQGMKRLALTGALEGCPDEKTKRADQLRDGDGGDAVLLAPIAIHCLPQESGGPFRRVQRNQAEIGQVRQIRRQ